MTDIRTKIFDKHSIENEEEYTLNVLHEKQALEAMDEYALLVLEKARLSYSFGDMYLSDLKEFLEEIKTELK